ncbi:MAG: iron-containing alcohol dehydrogenase, partial [Dehalococcoidia bacterium]
MPTEVVYGPDSLSQTGVEAKRLGMSKPLVVTDAGVKGSGLLDPAFDALKAAGIAFEVYDQAPTDPDTQTIAQVAGVLKGAGCDGVITAGGGSGLCTGKGAALMATNKGNIRDHAGLDMFENPPLPIIAIPTTAGSGSDVSKVTVITDESTHRKITIIGYFNAPRVAILDPVVLRSVPKGQAVASGVDALTHALEAYVSSRATPLTDAIALDAFETIAHDICPSILGGDREAQERILLAASMANIACGNAGLGLVHAVNGALTWLYKSRGYTPVAYGMLHAILLPPVLEFNLYACERKFASLGLAMGVGDETWSQADLAWGTIDRIKELLIALDAPRRLPWDKVPAEDWKAVAEFVAGHGIMFANPRQFTEADL